MPFEFSFSQMPLPLELDIQKSPGLIERLGVLAIDDFRPTGEEPIVFQDVAENLTRDLLIVLKDYQDVKETSFQDIILEILLKNQNEHFLFLLKEKYFWLELPEDALMEIISTVPDRLLDARFRLISIWVAEKNIMVPFQEGQNVQFLMKKNHEMVLKEGIINHINHKFARVTVMCPDLGHRADDFYQKGFVLNYEDLGYRKSEYSPIDYCV